MGRNTIIERNRNRHRHTQRKETGDIYDMFIKIEISEKEQMNRIETW